MSNVTARVIGLNVLNNYGDMDGPAISELQFLEPDPHISTLPILR